MENQDSANKFVFRTPLLPLSELVRTEEELLARYKAPLLRDALQIASEDLYGQLIRLEAGEVTAGKKRDKVLVSLYKYYTRMCTRCTPFGFFSGTNVGDFGERTSIRFSGEFTAHTRLDMDYLCNLYEEIIKQPFVKKGLIYLPNNTLYKAFGQWRYVEYRIIGDMVRQHNLVSIDDTEILSMVIGACANGLGFNQIVNLIKELGIDVQLGEEYVHQLIDDQVLTSNIYPNLTGEIYQASLFSELARIDPTRFGNLSGHLDKVLGNGMPPLVKSKVAGELLSEFNVPGRSNRLLQTDMLKKPKECYINANVRDIVQEVVQLSSYLMIQQYDVKRLENFKRAFAERYEGAFVPLTQVLDPDLGIGYKNAISSGQSSSDLNAVERQIQAFKLGIFLKAMRSGTGTVEITKEQFTQFKDRQAKRMPNSYYALVSLMEDKAGETTIRFENAGGPSSVNLIARFGFMDPAVQELCVQQAAEDQAGYPGAIVAEIVHFPQGRIGNVLLRPHFRDYEITYLGSSSLPPERQIRVSDLYIGPKGDRLVLFSKKHNKEVMPRLSTAHNFHFDSLPIYQFLCDLQSQNAIQGVFWSWDELTNQEMLPRVTYKNVVLSLARWNVNTARFSNETADGTESLFERLKELQLPMRFRVCQADNDLYIDMDTRLGRMTFLRLCSKNTSLVVEEFIYDQDNTTGGYTNEVIIPYTEKPTVSISSPDGLILDQPAGWTLSPFSRCVFFKLYTGKKYAEKLLSEVIPRMVADIKKKDILSKWFFIRYSDPKHHLRLRFFVRKNGDRELLLSTVNKYLRKYIAADIIWDLQIATYRRELDRYGEDTMTDSETWFCYDSEMVLQLLPLMKKLNDMERNALVLYYMDSLLAQFGLDTRGKLRFTQAQSTLYNTEFNIQANKAFRTRMNDEFRVLYRLIKTIFEDGGENRAAAAAKKLMERQAVITDDLVKNIKAKIGGSETRLGQIAGSFIHMHVNRLFSEDQRHKEMVLFYWLAKYYGTTAARNIYNP